MGTQPNTPPSQMLIKDMHFSNQFVGTRIKHVLQHHGVVTLEQLLDHTEQDLLGMWNFGTTMLAELTVKLKRMNLELKRKETW